MRTLINDIGAGKSHRTRLILTLERSRGRVFLLAALLLLLALAACDSPDEGPDSPPGGEKVSFTAPDGVSLSGYLWGEGARAVVLAHMYPADQTSWFDYAKTLADKGLLVFTFDFRGYGESEGKKEIELIEQDLIGAVQEVVRRGAQRVTLVGASMGGTAALKVAATTEVAGVATLSAPIEFRGLSAEEEVTRVSVPKLFLGAEDDEGGEAAQDLFAVAPEPKEILLVPGADHGTDLLTGSQGQEVEDRLSEFLETSLGADAP